MTFDLDSVTTKNSRKCSSKISSNSSEDHFSSYSADEEDEKNSEKGNTKYYYCKFKVLFKRFVEYKYGIGHFQSF